MVVECVEVSSRDLFLSYGKKGTFSGDVVIGTDIQGEEEAKLAR